MVLLQKKNTLAETIRELRKLRGLSQYEAAVLAGVSLSLWNKLESGNRVTLTCLTLGRLEKALKAHGKLWSIYTKSNLS